MIIRKDRGVRVLKYTFVIMGAICLTQIPMTNSKYITSSELNNDYFEYQTGLYQLSYPQENIPTSGTKFQVVEGTEGKRARITFEVPRSSIDKDGDKNTYRFDTESKYQCKVVSVDETAADSKTYEGYSNKPIKVSIECDAETSESEDEFLSVKIPLSNTISTNGYVKVMEKVNDEDEFIYRTYEGSLSKTEVSGGVNKTLNTSSNIFTNLIKWIIQYSSSESELSNNMSTIKDYIKDILVKDITSRYGSYNEDYWQVYVGNYDASPDTIPNIKGISKKKTSSEYEFAVEPNLLGYAKTYMANKDLESDSETLDFYFSVYDGKTDTSAEVESIFKYYVDTYIDSENANAIKGYVDERGGVYQVLQGNNNVAGLISDEVVLGHLRVYNKSLLIQMANLPSNTLYINEVTSPTQAGSKLARLFTSIRGIMEDNTNMRDMIVYSFGEYTDETNNHYIYDYIARDTATGITYEGRKYFIYRSINYPTRYILVKIEPDNERADQMNMYFSYLDEAIAAGPTGIFEFDKTTDEIYINIDTLTNSIPSAKDYNAAVDIVTMLNSYLNNTYSIDNDTSHIVKSTKSGKNMYYYNYKYEFVQTLSDEQGESENMLENNNNASLAEETQADSEILSQESFDAPMAENKAYTEDKNINSIQDIKTDKQNSEITNPELSGKDKSSSSTIKNDDNVGETNKTESGGLNNNSPNVPATQAESVTPEVIPIS